MYSASFACDGHLGCLWSFATPVMLCTNASLHYVCVSLEMFQKIHMDGSETAYPRSAKREAALARLSSLWKHLTEMVGKRGWFLLAYGILPCLLVLTTSLIAHHLGSSLPRRALRGILWMPIHRGWWPSNNTRHISAISRFPSKFKSKVSLTLQVSSHYEYLSQREHKLSTVDIQQHTVHMPSG